MSATTQQLIARWIEPNPHKPGAENAWVLPRCVSVWVIVRQLELDHGNVAIVADGFELPTEAIEAAQAYYDLHRTPIDERIREHRAFFGV